MGHQRWRRTLALLGFTLGLLLLSWGASMREVRLFLGGLILLAIALLLLDGRRQPGERR